MSADLFRGVDHIVVRVKDAQALMHLFANVLALPVSWPLRTFDFATYGWVTLGNTNLEFWASASNDDLPPEAPPPLFHGFALDPPELATSLSVLADRGVACKPPRPFVTRNARGENVTNFTNSVVLDVSSASCCVFFCAWGDEGSIFPWTEKRSPMQRQQQEQKQLDLCQGGALGVTGLVAIEMGVPDMRLAHSKWQAITGSDSDALSLGRGVNLNLIPGKDQKIQSIVLCVQSLSVARAFLDANGLLGADSPDEISLAPRVCSGLNFRFRQARLF